MEVKYQELLILAYFKVNYKKYEFKEIVKIMGMTSLELRKSLEHLFDLNYLVYIEQYVVITKKGEQLLLDKNLDKIFVQQFNKFSDKKQWNIDEPYIPIGFEI